MRRRLRSGGSESDSAALLRPATERERKRLEILCGDVLENQLERPCDAMVFCLFESTEETLRAAAAQCAGPAILVKQTSTARCFSSGIADLEGFTPGIPEETLRRLGVPFQAERLELGQPLRFLEEAGRFFGRCNRGTAVSEKKIRQRLRRGPSPEFPYYLPNRKRLDLVTFAAGAQPLPAVWIRHQTKRRTGAGRAAFRPHIPGGTARG